MSLSWVRSFPFSSLCRLRKEALKIHLKWCASKLYSFQFHRYLCGCGCVFYIYFCSLQIMIIQHTKLFARYLIRNEQTFQPIGNLIFKVFAKVLVCTSENWLRFWICKFTRKFSADDLIMKVCAQRNRKTIHF